MGICKPRFDSGTFVCQPLYLACQIISARPVGALVGDVSQYVAAAKRRPDFQCAQTGLHLSVDLCRQRDDGGIDDGLNVCARQQPLNWDGAEYGNYPQSEYRLGKALR
jgi:hypothetical protein